MAISEKEIKRLSNLARVEITDEEIEKLAKDMEDIVKMVDKIQELPLDMNESVFEPDGEFNIFRDDIPEKNYTKDEIIKNAPNKMAGCFVVPKIVE